jgi:autotransporter-associated beta strand protein
LLLSGVNTYQGDTAVSAGTLSLADNAGLTFYIGSNGINNAVTGTGTLNLDGDFYFNLSSAGTGSWNIVDVGGLSETFGLTFMVNGWTDNGNDTWSTLFGGNTYTFSEVSGVLATVPEPSTYALFGTGLVGLLVLCRNRRVA